MKFKFSICFLLILMLSQVSAFAQNLTVSGKVLEKNGEPIIGAAVIQADKKTNGTVTDLDGAFTIIVPQGSSLIFSSLGFSELTVKASSSMEIILEPDTNFLDEVVVVGYGVQKKSNLTGSISTIDSKDIEGRTITTLSQALQGKSAGVNLFTVSAQPGAVPTVRIRGIASNGTSDPLYVVDGLITTDISGIDPNTIESMEVLKDAASAAIYGAQAGNGVILINTKKGGRGTGSISYDYQLSLSSLARKPKLITSQDWFTQQMEKSSTFTEEDMLLYIDRGYWDGKSSTDWYSEVFTTSPTSKHTITAQGANDKGSFYLSLNSLDEDGIVKMKKDYYKRLSVSLNADYNIKPWMKVGITADYAHYSCGPIVDAKSTHGEGYYLNIFGNTISQCPVISPTFSPDMLPETMANAIKKGFNLYADENGNYYQTITGHPLITVLSQEKKNYGNKLSGVMYANFTPVKGLTFTSRLGFNMADAHTYQFNHKAYLNDMMQVTYHGVSRANTSYTYYQLENFANYSKSFGKHDFTLMAGMSYSENETTLLSGSISITMEDDPLFADISFASSEASKDLSGHTTTSRKLSYFGRASYSYDGKYLAEIVMRADAADLSVLPASNRWGYFPSASAGWVVSQEDFFKQISAPVSFLKLRASWGINGSTSNLTRYSYSNSLYQESAGYSFSNTGMTYQTVVYPTQLYNPSLKWETSQQLDLGIDARLFNDKLSITADYFDKQTKDLIISDINVPYEAGNYSAPVNAGNIDNRGFELDLGWKDTIGDFFYSVSGNIATLKNEVTYLDPNVANGRLNGSNVNGSYITAFEEGFPIWYFRGYQVDHLDETGAPVFKDNYFGSNDTEKGVINDNDKVMIGKPLPDFTYGITLSTAWKGFDLTVFGSGSYGNDVLMAYNVTSISYDIKSIFDQRWTPSNPNGKFAAPSTSNADKYACSDAMLFDGSFFRIKQILLGYTLPKNISTKFFVDRLRVYASLDNAFLFTSYPGIDPEVASNAITGIGIDYGSYPTTKKYVFGLSVTF